MAADIPRLFTIAPDKPLLEVLAEAVVGRGFPCTDGKAPGKLDLARWTILLPTRRAVREMIENYGSFLEVHVATSVEECERRDRKGLYKLAREGKIKEFTGISDPYEAPTTAELVLDTQGVEVDHCAHQVILKLESLGLIKA